MILLLLGAPGAGKGTQAKKLADELNLKHLAPGDILREEVKNKTMLGKQARSFMEKGALVPDDVIIDMMISRIEKEEGIVLDGFPRTINQAEALDTSLSSRGKKLDFVINIEVSEDEIIKRMSGRRVCPKCGSSYNIVFNPPAVEGKCDDDGETLIQRKDDSEETVRSRINVYREQTEPLIEYYRKKGNFYSVDGRRSVVEIYSLITDIIS